MMLPLLLPRCPFESPPPLGFHPRLLHASMRVSEVSPLLAPAEELSSLLIASSAIAPPLYPLSVLDFL